MKSFKVTNVVSLSVLVALAWLTAPGCKPSVGSYCDKLCDCVGCSQPEREECVDLLDDYRKQAEADGCGGEFDAMLSCANEELVCTDGQLEGDGCEPQAEKLYECTNAEGGGPIPGAKTACDLAADAIIAKYEECNIAVTVDPDAEMAECTEALGKQSICVADCTTEASCETLKGEDQDGAVAYAECIGGC